MGRFLNSLADHTYNAMMKLNDFSCKWDIVEVKDYSLLPRCVA